MNFFLKFRFHNFLHVVLMLCIFLIYACPDSTEVSPGAGACFTATMKFTPPPGCTTSSCCDTDLASFVFVRTDVPDFDPIILPPFGGGLPHLSDGVMTCFKTSKLWTSDITGNGFGTWQVTHRFAPNWEVTCPEVEITQCPTLSNSPPVPFSLTTVGNNECTQQMQVHGE